MRPFSWFVATGLSLLLLPAAVPAQASVTGQVRDSSGAVLPGVTVELSSPVLIERVRTAETDGSGRYQFVDLRPGDYTVTFTLLGFTTVRHEGIALTGGLPEALNIGGGGTGVPVAWHSAEISVEFDF